jgi:hypothetical protein
MGSGGTNGKKFYDFYVTRLFKQNLGFLDSSLIPN